MHTPGENNIKPLSLRELENEELIRELIDSIDDLRTIYFKYRPSIDVGKTLGRSIDYEKLLMYVDRLSYTGVFPLESIIAFDLWIDEGESDVEV